MFRGNGLDAIDGEYGLKVDRVLRPERPVIVKDGDSFRRLYEILLVLFIRHTLDEIDDALFRFAFVPRT